MEKNLSLYRSLLGSEAIEPLVQLASSLQGVRLVHVNSTLEGGGVAEILKEMVPLTKELGLDVEWVAIQGNEPFFRFTKQLHNLLQGQKIPEPDAASFRIYEQTNAENAVRLEDLLKNADVVFIHDPQPLPLLQNIPDRKGKWIWRCHIDLSSPSESTWDYLKKYIQLYDASIFSMKDFAQTLPHPVYFIPPSIDPLSEKNIELDEEEIHSVYRKFGIETTRPMVLQVSRFDRFKDPVGVIQSVRLARSAFPDLQLVLAGSGASDDPEGEIVFREALKEADNDPNIHLLLLSPDSHRIINALQRGASIVIQKSLKEGFGLTVSEALWKSKPVIGGNCGGIRLQVIDRETGFLVDTPMEAAQRIEFLLRNTQTALEMGLKGRQLVKEKFLITRHLKDYLTVISDFLKQTK